MRALAGGSLVLGFAFVLMSWDVSKRYAFVNVKPLAASFQAIGTGADSSPAQSSADGTRGVEGPQSVDRGSSSVALARAQAMGRPGDSSDRDRPDVASARANAPALPVRQFTPGSKGHVEAIVTAIDSEESRNTVAPLARLYFAFFDRAADYEGLNYYIDERHAGSSLDAIAAEFAGSEEFRLRYGALDNAAFFDRVYRNIFDAVPDAAQRASWIAQLDAGMSRGQLMVAFSESGAFQAATSNEVFVTMAYAEALRREPDPAGLARWVRFLDAGNPREAVIAGLLGSTRTQR